MSDEGADAGDCEETYHVHFEGIQVEDNRIDDRAGEGDHQG